MEQDTKGKFKIKSAIMILSSVLTIHMLQSLMLAGISADFPNKSLSSVQTIYTTASLAGILAGFTAGWFASKINKKRLCMIFGALALIGAALGFFFSDCFPILFVASFLMGFGISMNSSLLTAMMSEYFSGNERVGIIGAQTFFIHAPGALFSLLAAYLLTIGWKYVYLVALVLIPVSIAGWILLPEGDLEKPAEGEKVKATNSYMLSQLCQAVLFGLGVMTVFTNASYAVIEAGIDVSFAGVLNSVYEVVVVAIGLVLTWYVKLFKKNSAWVGFMLVAVSLFIFAIAQTKAMFIIACIIRGIGYGAYICCILAEIPNHIHPMTITTNISRWVALLSAGMFVNPYVVTMGAPIFFSDTSSGRFLLSAIILAVSGIVFKIIDAKILKKEAQQNA